METYGYRSKWLVYSTVCFIADIWDSIASQIPSAVKHPQVVSKTSDIDGFTDDEILSLSRAAPRLGDGSDRVLRLSHNTVAKYCYQARKQPSVDCPEANACHLVYTRTTIPVPRIHRVIKVREHLFLVVMDYIEGPTLAEAWPRYSIWQKIQVAMVLRRYVKQLHTVEATPQTPPGPISDAGPRVSAGVSSLFGQVGSFTRGPFASYEELTAYMEHRYALYFRDHPQDTSEPGREDRFDNSRPLVLTHNDLNPRNIIVGRDGRLWVVDWDWAGFYPRWFELYAMSNQVFNEELGGWYDYFWELMVPFFCGPYFKQESWLRKAAYGLSFK